SRLGRTKHIVGSGLQARDFRPEAWSRKPEAKQRVFRRSMATEVATKQKIGKVVQVIGPVVDIEFADGHLPDIYNAVHIVSDGSGGSSKMDVVCEVEQHLGENRVRTVSMKPTDGMQRGMTAVDLGGP